MCEMYRRYRKGNEQEATAALHRLIPIFDAMFCEANPVPVKYAAALLGLCECEYRLPLCEPTPENCSLIRQTVEAFREKARI